VDSVNDTKNRGQAASKALKNIHVFAVSRSWATARSRSFLDTADCLESSEVLDNQAENLKEEQVEKAARNSPLCCSYLNDESRFAMPLSVVSRLEEFQASKIERSTEGEVVQYRGQVMPLLRMAGRLESRRAGVGYAARHRHRHGDRSIGIAVHRLLDIVEESQRPAPNPPAPAFSHGHCARPHDCIRRSLRVIRPRFLATSRQAGFKSGAKSRRKKDGAKCCWSMTTLSSETWRGRISISQASRRGGVERRDALQRLRSTVRFDYIISDLETPAVDGCALARPSARSESEPHSARCPVCAGIQHNRQRALDAGFCSYLVKIDGNNCCDDGRNSSWRS